MVGCQQNNSSQSSSRKQLVNQEAMKVFKEIIWLSAMKALVVDTSTGQGVRLDKFQGLFQSLHFMILHVQINRSYNGLVFMLYPMTIAWFLKN